RTCDRTIRTRMLYPAELCSQFRYRVRLYKEIGCQLTTTEMLTFISSRYLDNTILTSTKTNNLYKNF
ncbi:hypothetical protein, partial [Streptococcus suis]